MDWDGWPEQAVALFQAIRSEHGEEMVLENNFFIENMLPAGVLRKLSDAERQRSYFMPDSLQTVFITGANRGIGLGFTTAYLNFMLSSKNRF